jgi:hypothetical protein
MQGVGGNGDGASEIAADEFNKGKNKIEIKGDTEIVGRGVGMGVGVGHEGIIA